MVMSCHGSTLGNWNPVLQIIGSMQKSFYQMEITLPYIFLRQEKKIALIFFFFLLQPLNTHLKPKFVR